MKPILFLLIKCLSTVLMTAAIGLEIWYFQTTLIQSQQLPMPPIVLWLAHFVLVAHSIEGGIAAVYATRQQRSPVFYAIYTFFVGTVGLIELFNSTKTNQPPLHP